MKFVFFPWCRLIWWLLLFWRSVAVSKAWRPWLSRDEAGKLEFASCWKIKHSLNNTCQVEAVWMLMVVEEGSSQDSLLSLARQSIGKVVCWWWWMCVALLPRMETGAACIFHICCLEIWCSWRMAPVKGRHWLESVSVNPSQAVFLFLKCSSSIWKILTDVGDGLPRCWNNKNRASLRLESICLFYSKFSSKTLLGRRVPDESLLYHSWLKRFTPNFVHSLCCEKKTVAFKSHLGEFLLSILVFFLLFSSRDFLR